MSTRRGDAALEQQMSLGIVQQSQSGCLGSEAPGFRPIRICLDRNTWQGSSAIPKRASHPIPRHFFGLKKQHRCANLALAMRKQPVQFANASSNAWTFWMRKHNQREACAGADDVRLLWP